jgi:hypothetical protein
MDRDESVGVPLQNEHNEENSGAPMENNSHHEHQESCFHEVEHEVCNLVYIAN